jgi:hypothetical protein
MRLRGIIVIGAALSIIVGFFVGRTVIANSPAPGSNADPVVSQSYVDKALEERVKTLESELAELAVQASAIQDTINEIQGRMGNTTSSKPSTPATADSTENTSNTPANKPASNKPAANEPKAPAQPPDAITVDNQPENKPSAPPVSQGGDNSVIGKAAYTNVSSPVRLRSTPTTADDSNIIKRVTQNDPLVIQKAENDWYYVKLNDGTEGWIYSDLVNVQ